MATSRASATSNSKPSSLRTKARKDSTASLFGEGSHMRLTMPRRFRLGKPRDRSANVAGAQKILSVRAAG